MRQILWFFTWVGIALWSLLLWIAHGAASFVSGLLRLPAADGFMPDHGPLHWLLDRLGDMASATTVLVWLLGVLMLYGCASLVSALFSDRRQALPPPRRHGPWRYDA